MAMAISGAFFSAPCSIGHAQQASKQDDASSKAAKENRYLNRLKNLRNAYEQSLGKAARPTDTKSVIEFRQKTIRYYDYQIENVEEAIEAGEPFGEVEYRAALDAVQLEIRRSIGRQTEAMRQSVGQLNEADRRFAEQIRAVNQEFNEKTNASKQEFQRTTAASNLKFKFTVNDGDLAIVIWNLPANQALHRRFSQTVNIRLFNGPKIVFRSDNVRLQDNHARNPIRLPRMLFDRVEIDIATWSGSGGGLAEVEVCIGNENVASGKPCQVSNFETQPVHLDDQHALTDGVTNPTVLGEGYWIPEERTKATVSIDLLGALPDSVAGDPKKITAGR